MAEAVQKAIENGHHLLAEAGTGTGKTLAYLIPAIAAGKRIIVSTGTKNLQEQLFSKDIPFLQEAIPRKFRAAYMKGRSNYACIYRLKKAETTPILQGLDEVDEFDVVRRWALETEIGDRAELVDLPEHLSFWNSIDARSDTCLGQKCPDFEPCFITRMRQRALDADIVIVNHHLFFADLALRDNDYGAVLPDYDIVIFDEAHELEDIAAGYFGAQVSNYRIADLIRDANMAVIPDADASIEISRICARLQQRSDHLFAAFMHRGGPTDGRYTLSREHFFREDDGSYAPNQAGESFLAVDNTLDAFIATLNGIKEAPAEIETLIRRAKQIKGDLDFIVTGDDPTFVYWYERRGRGVFLQATPIDVSGLLSERLFENVNTAILTSATLTTGGSFDFIRKRLGIKQADEVIVDSHFDFGSQSILYLPKQMPDPRSPQYTRAAVEEIVKILQATSGRAFVLFTSLSAMREAHQLVTDRIDFPLLIQGQGSKTGLLEKFKTTPNAVLFATSSFWQGVDVQGEALSCVIIDKLPFAVPSDPVVSARQKYIEAQGGNSFTEYSVPEAIITLKQGLGRLIRSTTDVGVLSVLDPRLRTKAYGRVFLESLPNYKITSKIEDLSEIFAQQKVV